MTLNVDETLLYVYNAKVPNDNGKALGDYTVHDPIYVLMNKIPCLVLSVCGVDGEGEFVFSNVLMFNSMHMPTIKATVEELKKTLVEKGVFLGYSIDAYKGFTRVGEDWNYAEPFNNSEDYLKKLFDFETNACNICDGVGCPSCEPKRYI